MEERFDEEELDFEFERKFFVRELPGDVREHGSVEAIVQAYLFAEDGYAVRVRLLFPDMEAPFTPFDEAVDYCGAYERRTLDSLMKQAGEDMRAVISVKSPMVTAERYEFERELDVDVAWQILRRSTNMIVKNRFSLWIDEDGWVFDVFGGQNEGLILAECERLQPVVSLAIPDFCVTEVSGDLRFTNDFLSKEPWRQWRVGFESELANTSPHFLDL